MHAEIAFTGQYHEALSKRIIKLAAKGGLLVDVGSNIGYFSLLWAACNRLNRVHSFEPSPRNISVLRHNVSTNGFDNIISIHDIALGYAEGSMSFDLGPEGITGWGGLVNRSDENTIDVRVERLDDVLLDADIDFLKIDVEGADTWVLMGAKKLLLEKRVKFIHFEQNKGRLAALDIRLDEAETFLNSMGYVARPVTDPGRDVVDWIAFPVAVV